MNEEYGKTDTDSEEMGISDELGAFLDQMILKYYKDELEADVAAAVAEKMAAVAAETKDLDPDYSAACEREAEANRRIAELMREKIRLKAQIKEACADDPDRLKEIEKGLGYSL